MPPPTSVNPDAVTVAVRTYLDGRFSAERAQIDIWKGRNYGTTYLSFLATPSADDYICTQHLSIVFSSRRIHSVNTDDGHPFTSRRWWNGQELNGRHLQRCGHSEAC